MNQVFAKHDFIAKASYSVTFYSCYQLIPLMVIGDSSEPPSDGETLVSCVPLPMDILFPACNIPFSYEVQSHVRGISHEIYFHVRGMLRAISCEIYFHVRGMLHARPH